MRALKGLSEISEEFDGFILDLWGLIHDGVTAYPGVVDTFKALIKNETKTILLSNAPRRSRLLIDGMTAMGIAPELYGDVFSSGEATWQELTSRSDPFFSRLGHRAYHIGPERDVSVLEETGIQRIQKMEQADFVLNTGPVELDHGIEAYEPVLLEALARDLPMVCANPDDVVMREGRRVVCAGAIARRYEALGGRAVYRGKPDPAVYNLAAKRLGISDRSRIAVIGDALETDVSGANASGLKAIWCTGGIHGEALGVSYGEAVDPKKAAQLAAEHDRVPWATIPGFQW
ncbi:MAG: TIGR01459 family HAD-type hydrolase [Alphaproteobacteria bacterium]|nr:TIGR01459 family HAD-type hydrolase [Alphaproteobacteria bacterium]